MNVSEMEGFLRGKCLPGDIKVNESNAEYLVRKLGAVCELQGEITALAATLEKCRELSGCPAGVDLQDWVKQLAAESLTLKQFPEQIVKFIGSLGSSEIGSDTKEKIELAANRIKTPATDRIVAGIKADGVEEFAAYCGEENSVFVEAKAYYRSLPDAAYEFAQQLREGADK
ncbi:hypothetical protein ACVB8K_003549 [Klebsiella aerogenes]